MEEKTLKINNIEFNCQTLIEFSSLINALIEMAKKQKETEKKLGEHEMKINNLFKLISTQQKEPKETGIGWQDKENEISNILNDENIFSINYNNSNLSNYINAETLNDAQKQPNNLLNNNVIEEKEMSEEKGNKEENMPETEMKKEKEKETSNKNSPNKEIKEEPEEKKDQKQTIVNDNDNNNQNLNENQNNQKIKEQIPNTNININNTNEPNNNIIPSTTEKKQTQGPINVIPKKHDDKSNKNTEIISKIFQRVVLLEKKVAELMAKSSDNMIIRTLNTNKQSINDHSNTIKQLKELTDNLNKDVNSLKEKMQDFNIYDMFKDGGDGNIDIAKALIKALEVKHTKRFELLEAKYKVMSTESFKNKDDINNLGIMINGQKLSLEKSNEKINKIIEEQKEKEIKDKELKDKEKLELNEKFEDVNNNLTNLEKNYDIKLLELESKLSSTQKAQPVLVTDLKPDKKKEKRDNELLNMIKEYNVRIQDLEKSMRQLLKKINIEELNSNLAILQKEVSKKGNQGAIDDIIDRIYNMDEIIKQLSYRVDSSQAFEKKSLEENSFLSKKLETFANQVNRLSMQVIKNPKEEKPVVDFTKFIEIGAFEENKKEINRKFDKIRISFEDILRHIDEILDKLSHTPTDKDFAQYQDIIKNMLDEYKINNNKKYADKYDTLKSFKFLETQIKSMHESYNKKLDGQDNWLLAKKPLNNYLCASCEGIIRGELDKRCEYIPWNKYPNREEKYTRMGHGFSHMLQMVNDDIRKNVDNKEKEKDRNKTDDKEKDYNSDEDKKKTSGERINSPVKLPKVKLRPRNYNNVNLIEDATWDKSPYDNVDRNLTMVDNSPQIMKISRIKKNIINKNNSTQEASSINDDNSSSRVKNALNIKTLPSDLSSFDKKQGDSE